MSREELIPHAWDLTSGEGTLSPKDHFVLLVHESSPSSGRSPAHHRSRQI